MLTNQLVQNYALAIYELASQQQMIDQVEAELGAIVKTIAEHRELQLFMDHRLIAPAAKKQALLAIFAGQLHDSVQNFLLLLVDKRRETALPAIARQYVHIANQARNVKQAEAIVAKPLSAMQQQALTDKLGKVLGCRVTLQVTVDKTILGGIIVRVGGKLIDASLVRQLQSLQAALTAV